MARPISHCSTQSSSGTKGYLLQLVQASFFALAHGAFLYFTVPLFCNSLGFRPSEIGWIISAFGAGHAFGAVFMGPLSDHTKRRKPFLFMGFFGPGMVILAFTQLHGVFLMVLSTLILGLVTSPNSGVVPALISESAPKMPAAAMGIGKSAEALGLFVGPMVGGILIPHLGFNSTMLLYAAITIAGSLIFIIEVPEPLSLKTAVKS